MIYIFILDRFEEGYAFIEATDENSDVRIIRVEKSSVSPESKEGDVLLQNDGFYTSDTKATIERKMRIINRLRRLRNKK